MGLYRVLYQDNDRYDVLLAASAEVAQEILSEQIIDILVTDIRLPGISGIDLLCWAAAQRLNTRVFVITAFDSSGIATQAYRLGCIRILQKPFDLHDLRKMILDALDHKDGLRGRLADLSAPDLLQVLSLAKKTTSLRIIDGDILGMIYLKNGEIIHATWADEVGENAIFALLRAESGVFDTIPLPETELPRTITASLQELLLEGMRVADELVENSSSSAAAKVGRSKSSETSTSSNGASEDPDTSAYDELIEQGLAAMRSGKVAEARTFWDEARRLKEVSPATGEGGLLKATSSDNESEP